MGRVKKSLFFCSVEASCCLDKSLQLQQLLFTEREENPKSSRRKGFCALSSAQAISFSTVITLASALYHYDFHMAGLGLINVSHFIAPQA